MGREVGQGGEGEMTALLGRTGAARDQRQSHGSCGESAHGLGERVCKCERRVKGDWMLKLLCAVGRLW